MASEVKSGQWINVKVISQPRAAARIKTMIRLFEKDEAMKRERSRLVKSRPTTKRVRGGRDWIGRPSRLAVVKLNPGATYKIFATVAVLRDLKSVEKYVEVTAA